MPRYWLLFCICSSSIFAQTAQITGRVTDDSGAVVPSASVAITETSTGQRRVVSTNDVGYYTAPLLQPGGYKIVVEKFGFQSLERTGLNLQVNEVARLDFTLNLGRIAEHLTVAAVAPVLDRETSALGQVVQSQQVLELPLLGRNPYALGMLVPGVRTSIGMNNLVTDVVSTAAVSINGGRNNMNSFLLDGAPNTAPLQNQPIIYANVDSVQEFKVDTNNFSAEYGRAAGGVFNVVTKTGTNDLHFTAFEFLRNNALNANDWFANRAGQPQAPFRLNQFGGVLGGPVVLPHIYNGRNRTFFFVSTELVRFSQGVTFNATVPTPQQLAGDFNQTFNSAGRLITIYDPLTTQTNPAGGGSIRTPFAGNVIPTNRIDPVARNMLKYWPAPNTAGAAFTGVGNYVRTDANRISKNTFSTRLDHNFSEATRFFLRYAYDDSTNTRAAGYGFDDIASPVSGPQDFSRYNAVSEVDHIISPTFVSLLRLSYARLGNVRLPLSNGFDITQLGFPAGLGAAIGPPFSFPAVTITGYSVSSSVQNTVIGGTLGNSDIIANFTNEYTLAGTATKSFSKYTLKFGGEWRVIQLNVAQNGTTAGFNFSPSFTQGPNPAQSTATAGSALATFLLGVAGGTVTPTPSLALENKYRSLFIEDAWKVRKNLTVTLGLRYNYESPRSERFNQLTDFNFQATPPLTAPGLSLHGALAFVGINGVSRYQSNPDYNNFAPRIGVSWSALPRTVIRAGAGIFYAPTTGISGTASGFGTSGFQTSTTVTTSLDGFTPITYLRDPYPQGLNKATGSSLGAATLLGQNVGFYDRGNVVPYTGQWNFDVQRELPGSVLLDVAYVGSRGVKFPTDRQLDQLPDSALALGDALRQQVNNPFYGQIQVGTLAQKTVALAQLLRPFPQFTQVNSTAAGWSNSRYNALQVKVEKRYAKGLTLLASYTYSKMMDDSTGNTIGGETLSNGTNQNWNNLRPDWSTSALDQTHRLIFSTVYALPWYKKQPSFVGRVLGGWELGGIVSFFSGAPLAMSSSVDNTYSQGGNPRPNWSGKSTSLPNPTAAGWFDISQFTQPAPYTFGNAPRSLNGLRSDGVKNLDLSLNKSTNVTEKLKLQLRAEAFNLPNRPQFAPPNTSQGAATFGVVSAMENMARILQFGLKLIY